VFLILDQQDYKRLIQREITSLFSVATHSFGVCRLGSEDNICQHLGYAVKRLGDNNG
jgi:hypothetical protein